jgi:methyl-accepting chemotaxis protein
LFRIDEHLQALTTAMAQKIAATKTELQQGIEKIFGLMGVVTLGMFAVMMAAAYSFTRRSITRPVERIIEGLTEGADQVAAASGQLSSASQSLAKEASQQAASIEETASTLEEMSAMTRRNAENAGHADGLMKDVTRVVKRAGQSVVDLTSSMREISTAGEETSRIIKT